MVGPVRLRVSRLSRDIPQQDSIILENHSSDTKSSQASQNSIELALIAFTLHDILLVSLSFLEAFSFIHLPLKKIHLSGLND